MGICSPQKVKLIQIEKKPKDLFLNLQNLEMTQTERYKKMMEVGLILQMILPTTWTKLIENMSI
jgi:hypothetical protein